MILRHNINLLYKRNQHILRVPVRTCFHPGVTGLARDNNGTQKKEVNMLIIVQDYHDCKDEYMDNRKGGVRYIMHGNKITCMKKYNRTIHL